MKSNKFKIIGIVLVVVIIIFGGLFYYASTKLRPEEIKKVAIEQTKKIFPRAEVNLEGVDIGWGLNFKINLQKFSMKAMKGDQQIEMISVNELLVKVPVWAIITGSGVVEVKMDAPVLNYHEFPEGNNWTYALGEKKSEEEQKKKEEAQSKAGGGASALGILGNSKINIKLSDIAVKYSLRDNSKGEVKVSKFLVKGLSFESSTAFELASNAKFVMKDQSVVSFDTIVIGEFNIADLLKKGSVSSTLIVKLSNISKTGLEWKFPEITTNVDVLLKKEGELSGRISSSFEGQNKVSANFKMTKAIEISDINADILLKDVAAIIALDKSIDMSKAKLKLNGGLQYTEDKKINANLTFSISPGIGYSRDGFVANTSLNGSLQGKELAVKVKTESMEGQINTSLSGVVDLSEKFEMGKLKPFDIRVVASGLKIPEKFIRAKLWDKKADATTGADDKKKAEAQVAQSNAKEVQAALPPSNIIVDWNNINVGGEDFSGHGKIVTSISAIAIDNMSFKFSKGTGKLSQVMTLGKTTNDSKFNFEVANLNLNSFKAFLPPFIENFSGTFTGKLNGSASMSKTNRPPLYDVSVVADAKNGEIKKLNVSDYINPLLANIPVVKDKMKDKQIKIDGNFETLVMKGRFTNSQYTISSFDFVGINKKVQITGSGEIYPQAGSKLSTMEVNFVDNTGKISEVLLANAGTKILPIRVSGPGFDMKPDYGYTVSKLAKGAVKTRGQEEVKKVIEKNLDKIVPPAAKEKVKGLLDGLFKKK